MGRMLLRSDGLMWHAMRAATQRMSGLHPQTGAHAGGRAWTGLLLALSIALSYVLTSATAVWQAAAANTMSVPVPAAGVALAAFLVFGRAAIPGALLGVVGASVLLAELRGLKGTEFLLVTTLTAVGALLQAWIGSILIGRFIRRPLALGTVRDILLAGTLSALVACAIGASFTSLTLAALGQLGTQAWSERWLAWWFGDASGVIVGAPLALSFMGLPRADWRARRFTVTLPLLAATAMWVLAMNELQGSDRERLQAQFERDADRLAALAHLRLSTPLYTLKALHSAARGSDTPDEEALREASQWWLRQSLHLMAMGHSVRLSSAEIPAYETAERARGSTAFNIHDVGDAPTQSTDGEVVVVRRIVQPQPGRARAMLGVNVLSIPVAREAVLAARDSGEATASAGFRLTQSDSDETAVVLYQALYSGSPASGEARRRNFRGVVFVTVNMARALGRLALEGEDHLHWCLSDADHAAARRHLASSPDERACNTAQVARDVLYVERSLGLGGRQLTLQVVASTGAMPGSHAQSAWLRPAVGLLGLSLLGALLLAVTGMARRTQRAVETATAELRSEMAERASAERLLRDSEVRLRSILDNLPSGVCILDTEGLVLKCNPKMCQMAGRSTSDLGGRALIELVHPDDALALVGQRHALLAGQNVAVTVPLRLLDPAGGDIQVRMRAAALRDSSGSLQRIVLVVEDLREEMRLLASERALSLAQLASRAKSDFMSSLSHDLRTPLNAIIGFAELLLMEGSSRVDPRLREWTQQILDAGHHLLELIDQTLELARLEAGCVRPVIATHEVAPIAAVCRSMVLGLARQRGVTLDERLAKDAPTVLADALRLKQVLTNLLSNGIKYNRHGGHVTLATRRHGADAVEISVADTGLGMTPEQVQGLFQPYNRLGRESSNVEGTGLGLVISRQLTELMGGELEVQSRAGEGSIFIVRLPCGPRVGVVTGD